MKRFSVIVVCLNPGDKLIRTVNSILRQSFTDYEIIVKDGGSQDGSIQKIQTDPGILQSGRVRLYVEKDKGIYDAMNQAVSYARGEFILFLNCGDVFYHDKVLEETDGYIRQEETGKTGRDADTDESRSGAGRLVLYGDTYSEKNDALIISAPRITGFTCYRNIPCHQSCFYSAGLCREKPYDSRYAIRADYDHFLWCFYRAGAKMIHMDQTVSSYEGGGFSENRENRKRDRQEHGQITSRYMGKRELLMYRLLLLCTLAPLRSMLAESRLFSGVYHWMKERIYHRKKWVLMGVLLFLLEMGILVWPAGLAGEDTVSFSAGEDMWLEEMPEYGVCQVFTPRYSHMKRMGFFLNTEEEEIPEGYVNAAVLDSEGEVLFEEEIPYSRVEFGRYTEFNVNLDLNVKKQYGMRVECHTEQGYKQPDIGLCGTQYRLDENRKFTVGTPGHDMSGLQDGGADFSASERQEVQMLTWYHYTDTIPTGKLLCILGLSLLTALGVCFGVPENARLRKGIRIFLFLAVPCILGSRLELLSVNTMFLQTKAICWNLGMMYLLEFIILFLTGSLQCSVIVTNVFLTVLYTVSHYVYLFRGNALRLNDFMAFRTAANVAGSYSLRPDAPTAMVWAILVLFVVYGFASGETRPRKKKKVSLCILSALAGILLSGVSGYLFLYTDLLEKNGFEELLGVNQQMTYQFNGYLVSTCLDIKNSRIKKPEGYSRERAEDILKEAAENYAMRGSTGESGMLGEAGRELPHVILIMNESFSDLRILGNLAISGENMGCFYGLEENTIRGCLNVSGLGGGTANSEFEVFTGCSMGLLPPSYYPYQQCFGRPLPSLVSHMKDAGYTTYSMHPETKLNYNRVMAYDSLGFEHSLWIEDFEGTDELHYGLTDRETYHKVEEIYENREEGEKLFIFDLTIQNHGDYIESDVEQTVTALNVSFDEVNNFLSLIRESDEAFGELISYFEKEDEKVLICMFGDHQPKFTDESFYEDIYRQTPGMTDTDKMMNQYKTPFLIWANYDIPEEDQIDISANYLGVLLQNTAGIPLSPYFAFLETLQEEKPVITINGCVDGEGNYYEQGENLEEYRILQYRYLFDPEIVDWGY